MQNVVAYTLLFRADDDRILEDISRNEVEWALPSIAMHINLDCGLGKGTIMLKKIPLHT